MKETIQGVLDSMRSSAAHFRRGDDHKGLDLLLDGVCRLENTSNSLSGSDLCDCLSLLKKLYECMCGKDIVGLTDILEYSLCPLMASLAGKDGVS